jgi:transcriptional regulator with XRE-family HTH domain
MQTPSSPVLVIRTPGMRLLRRAMEKRGLSQAQVAALVGCSQQSVSGWLRGAFVPTTAIQLARLEELLGVPSRAWLTTSQRRELARSRPAA